MFVRMQLNTMTALYFPLQLNTAMMDTSLPCFLVLSEKDLSLHGVYEEIPFSESMFPSVTLRKDVSLCDILQRVFPSVALRKDVSLWDDNRRGCFLVCHCPASPEQRRPSASSRTHSDGPVSQTLLTSDFKRRELLRAFGTLDDSTPQ